MTVSIEQTLRHMAWANEKLYAAVAGLPDAALTAYAVDPDWAVGRILGHLVESGEWYRYCLRIGRWVELTLPHDMTAVAALAERLGEIDAELLEQAALDDALLTQNLGEGDRTYPRSMILAQAAHHATEHRTQIVAALELRGYSALSLDDVDLWCFYAEVARKA